MQFGFLRQNVAPLAKRPARRRPVKRRRPSFDCLEDRRVLSVNPVGGIFTVNDTTAGTQELSSGPVAMDNNGDAVVAWSSQILNSSGQPTGNVNVMFKLYTHNADGSYTSGPETKVAVANQPYAMVARAPTTGEFAVVWASSWVDKKGYTEFKTYAEPFSAAGVSLTGNKPILVGGASNNFPNGVAMNDSGFDVLYGVDPYGPYYSTDDATVTTVQRYTAAGAAAGTPVTAFPVPIPKGWSAIATDPNGDFAVSWLYAKSTSPVTYTVDERYFSPSGAGVGPIHQITSVHHGVQGVGLGMDAAGNSVVSWWMNYLNPDGSLGATDYAETVTAPNAQGVSTLGTPITVVQSGVNGAPLPYGSPRVAVQPNGNFAVTWMAHDFATPQHVTVWADTFSAAGAALEAPFEVAAVQYNNTPTTTRAPLPAVATDTAGDLLVVWNDLGAAGNAADTGDVYGQFYSDPPPPALAASSPLTSSSAVVASPSGLTAAAADAAFASYAYPEDEEGMPG